MESLKEFVSKHDISKLFSVDDLFVLGRNIYQAAAGGAFVALQLIQGNEIETLIKEKELLNHILSGMIYEIFFDSYGQLRRLEYKIAFLDELFQLLVKDEYKQSLEFISRALKPFEHVLLILPSQNLDKIDFTVTLEIEKDEDFDVEIEVIKGITVNKEQLLIDNNGMIKHSLKTYLYENDIVTEIKKAFAIPSYQQSILFQPPRQREVLVSYGNKILWRGDLPKQEPPYNEFEL